MVSIKSVLLTLIAISAHVSAQSTLGKGRVTVLKTDNLNSADPSRDRIGCLNAQGRITLNDCAIFDHTAESAPITSSSGRNCTFRDQSQVTNTDSKYGQRSYAFSCPSTFPSGDDARYNDWFYTINGFSRPWLCIGDGNCAYDTKRAPTSSNDQLVFWQFLWGSGQLGITPGHIQLALLWERV